MRPLPNYNITLLDTTEKSLDAIEEQIHELIIRIDECDDTLSESDRVQLVQNIQWLKRFYESAERNLLNGN